MRDQLLPEDLQADDFVYVPNAGAYTTAYASNFNGFPLPRCARTVRRRLAGGRSKSEGRAVGMPFFRRVAV